MTRIQAVVISAKSDFEAKFGVAPNALLVSSNGELALNELRIKPGATFMGMTVICAEIVGEATVALILKSK